MQDIIGYANSFIINFWNFTEAMAPYLLLGFFLAGILYELIPEDLIKKHLGRDTFFSAFKATILGIPLPVCSCGVIPLATSLQKQGASTAAVLSFLISTPITGVDSILATFGIFGGFFTLYRVLSSIVIAFMAGIVGNLFVKNKIKPKEENSSKMSCCCKSTVEEVEISADKKKTFSLKSALKYGFITLFSDIVRPLFIGLLLGTLISILLPQNLETVFTKYNWIGYMVAIVVAVPLYVCATASLPIAASLILAGVSPGAAFVFLTAGPATNTVTIGVVKKMLGGKNLIIYLLVIIIGSVFFGLLLDQTFFWMKISPKSIVSMSSHANWISSVSASILLLLIFYFFLIDPFLKKKVEKKKKKIEENTKETPSCCSQ